MPWKTVLIPLLSRIINKILDLLGQKKRQANYEERQEKRNEAAENPRNSFNKHFSNGVFPDNSDSRDVTETSETNSGDSGESERPKRDLFG